MNELAGPHVPSQLISIGKKVARTEMLRCTQRVDNALDLREVVRNDASWIILVEKDPMLTLNRRTVFSSTLATLIFPKVSRGADKATIQFGLTPVFLTSDIELLTRLKSYLSRKCDADVQLVQRRTYEEITSLLLSGQLDAAWICGYPFAQYQSELALVAVPECEG